MAPTTNIFWCKVFFQAFIKHFRKLNDEQIVRDVRQSMDDLEDLVTDTDTFGSQMVRWALERAEEPAAIASANNGKKGGRPRKNQAEAPTRKDGELKSDSGDAGNLESATSATISDFSGARESQRRAGADSVRGTPLHSAPARSRAKNSRCPNSREDFHAFVADNNLHEALAEEWFAMHEARGWVDRDGKPIKDWKGALYNYCTKTEQKRRTA